MDFLISIMTFCLISSLGWSANNNFVDKGFKDAENTIIDILRLKDPTLDSRKLIFESTELQGGFAICCNTKKSVLVKNSQNNQILAKFTVMVGNTDYKNYENGILQTTIVTESVRPYVEPFWKCQEQVSVIIKDLFPTTASYENNAESDNSFASVYTFEVKDGSKIIGKIMLNAAECKLHSVILNPQPQPVELIPPPPY